MEARIMRVALAGLVLAVLGSPALAEPYPARDRNSDGRQVPSFGGAAQHYGDARADLRRARRHAGAVTVPPTFFYGSGGVGGQPAYAQTYVFYGVAYPRARAFTGVAANASARAVSQVQVRVDGH